MKKRLLLLCGLMVSVILYCDDMGIKPRALRKRNTTDTKQAIGTECEKILTLSTSLIASLTEQIDEIVKKIKALACGNDSFFAQKKAPQLEAYKTRLEMMRKKLETAVTTVEHELAALKHDFKL